MLWSYLYVLPKLRGLASCKLFSLTKSFYGSRVSVFLCFKPLQCLLRLFLNKALQLGFDVFITFSNLMNNHSWSKELFELLVDCITFNGFVFSLMIMKSLTLLRRAHICRFTAASKYAKSRCWVAMFTDNSFKLRNITHMNNQL